MLEPQNLLMLAATFVFAGMVKGVIGFGMPTVSLALLTLATDLTTAMALLLVPTLATNLWQAVVGGNARAILVRTWPFMATACATILLGTAALSRVELFWPTALLGSLMIAYGAVNIAGLGLRVPTRQEYWAGPAIGFVNGFFGGLTGSFVVPGIMYLQALGLSRDALVQAMGILFSLSTLALAIALERQNFLSAELGLTSALALLPASLGMAMGQQIRRQIPEAKFRQVFFAALLGIGTMIVVNAFARLS